MPSHSEARRACSQFQRHHVLLRFSKEGCETHEEVHERMLICVKFRGSLHCWTWDCFIWKNGWLILLRLFKAASVDSFCWSERLHTSSNRRAVALQVRSMNIFTGAWTRLYAHAVEGVLALDYSHTGRRGPCQNRHRPDLKYYSSVTRGGMKTF